MGILAGFSSLFGFSCEHPTVPCNEDQIWETYLSIRQANSGPIDQTRPIPVKQLFWDRPGPLQDYATVDRFKVDTTQMAHFLATFSPSGQWHLTFPVSSCGLEMDDVAFRAAVALPLWLALGAPHTCQHGKMVDASGVHAIVCKRAPSRPVRY